MPMREVAPLRSVLSCRRSPSLKMTFLVTMLPVRLAAIATTELPHRSRNGIERYLVFAAIASGDGDFRSGEAMSDASVGAALSMDEILEKIQRTIATDGQE